MIAPNVLVLGLFLVGWSPVRVAAADDQQGLTESAVMSTLRPYFQAVGECASRQKELDPSVTGRMEVAFTIAKGGRISRFEILTKEHQHTFVSGCVDGVLRTVQFPRFKGPPAVIPRFPINLGSASGPDVDSGEESELAQPTAPVSPAPRKLRNQVQRPIKAALPRIRACVQDQPLGGRKRARKLRTVSLSFVVTPLGRAEKVEIQSPPEHRTNHVAGCVAGVLRFVDLPSSESSAHRLSRIPLPRLAP